MIRKSTAAPVLLAALLVLCLPSVAAGPKGAIKGKVVDDKGAPLSGAYLYVTSPASLGITNYITSKTGRYGIVGLEPGTFKIVVEAPGFKTVSVDDVALSAGATATVNFKMEPTDIEEEPMTGRPGPTLDRDSSRAAVILDRELITRLPLHRDFTAVLGLVPGLVFEADTPGMRASFNGAPVTANLLVLDGVIATHPVDARAMGRINVDVIDEVVVETAGHAAEAGPAQGAYVNIVHRPGSGSPQGSLSYSASGRGLVDSLWTAGEIAEMDGAAAPALKREHDLSLTYGGPVLEDMAWLFANVRYKTQGSRAPFRYWTDPLGVRHFVYDYAERDFAGLFKLSMNVLDKFKGVLEFGFSGLREPVYEADIDRLRPESSTRELSGEGVMLGRGGFSYIVNQSTFLDLSVGYTKYKQPLILNEMASAKPQYHDVITGYSWGSGSLNDREVASRMSAKGTITRLLDKFLGMPHELVAGGEYETMYSTSSVWKADNLIHNYTAGSPYTFGNVISPFSGNDVGCGLIGFYIAPQGEGNMTVRRELKRLGAFAQDTMRIGGRISLSGGLRFDRSEARFPAVIKGASGNSVSVDLGNTLIDPLMGYNPYSTVSLGAWEKAIIWNSLSPRAGLSFDVLGNGRTLLKGSWARLPEYLGLGYSQDLAQVDPLASHDFFWFDEDTNGLVGTSDMFIPLPYDFRVYKSEYFRQAVDPDLKAPVIEEWTAGLEQEILRDFTLSVRYISRHHTNIIGHVLYDPSTQVPWWRLEDAPTGWWVPFSTVVPGTGGYADVPVTVYLRSSTAPNFFERIENVPDLDAKYRSLEFSFRKRMSRNWQLFGSFTWSRSTGTAGVASRWSAGNSPVLLNPNAFINIAATNRLLQDRPLVARLAGTVRFRWDIYLSFLFKAQSGAPWARTVTVIPPSDWAAANGADMAPVTVYLEGPGARRFGSWKNLDVRLEKEFAKAGRSLFAVSVDVFNLLGDKYRTLDLNDGGTWSPDGEGAGTGTRVLSGTYGKYWPLWGTRVVRLNLSLKF
ncbi:MAG: hypothetical protein A2V76_05715 [Candidatus Aminicenantes bacterium RBG_16_63_14]|nr:MAG: hypothetical protein A2V76_05715 [Candidatus Aminicenantes bacterium RBG_16_63_14]OGD25474.1 MAG: hypothetical protein A2V57_09865 [Candidatus Aminicenantes bacterium RBG_19FT_COMBO_65_30]